MIGIIVDPIDEVVAREFFELFKTPWEIYRENREYDVVLCSGAVEDGIKARVLLVYSGKPTRLESLRGIQTLTAVNQGCFVVYRGDRIPIYGDSVRFSPVQDKFLIDEHSSEAAAYKRQTADHTLYRVGYNLFAEIQRLLTTGQPIVNAGEPTLDLHIALLRDLIVDSGAELVEIPPVPQGHRFIVCLTHDVDHPSIKLHGWDHTTFGFLYRAVVGSARRLLSGRLSTHDLIRNWFAAIRLPFVQLGMARDYWLDFAERYGCLEAGLPSTFFVIPFSGRPGKKGDGTAPAFRAAGYSAQQIESTIRYLVAKGCEVGLHGIDAWTDCESAREEFDEIHRLTGTQPCGTRMHWLYSDDRSPKILEEAGASYDSTSGYNEAVGYRAGTTQVFRPIGTQQLLELPMHVMDTALFYPTHQDYSPDAAASAVKGMVDHAVRCGGCLTINWHDRSVVPERLWGSFYQELLSQLKSYDAWFASAGQAVDWFRMRRAAKIEGHRVALQTSEATFGKKALPGLQVKLYERQASRYGHVELTPRRQASLTSSLV